MYAVNASIPKTLVSFLVRWVADNMLESKAKEVLYRILDTPISPELLPPDAKVKLIKKTEDIIGPYELHDFFLYHMLSTAQPGKNTDSCKEAFEGKYTDDTIRNG